MLVKEYNYYKCISLKYDSVCVFSYLTIGY